MSDVSDWWRTSIIDMERGRIDIRGRPIADLIGNVSFPQMIWLMLRGDLVRAGWRVCWNAHWWRRSITGHRRRVSPRRGWR